MRRRLSTYRDRTRERLEEAFSEDHPPRDVAATFSVGLFVAALPNFGLALVCFALAARYLERVSNLALVAVLLVMNPPVKWVIYGVGFWLGSRLLGPVPGVTGGDLSLAVGPAVLVRLFVGTAVVAAGVAIAGHLAALRFIRELRRRDLELAEEVADAVAE
ncbi:DUF2062 domain-containing protein [Haloparvum sedimenti]|uniref:DUF2062 domain-containing protein n=1 Tax=Haloparvum sedimenti TaxID=1678448 RepID=UPI00071E8CA9|nr:DUF2062 domain-containing protein [Haloparvum sedimenti]